MPIDFIMNPSSGGKTTTVIETVDENRNYAKYKVHDIAYIKESAALGFIEAVKISGVHMYKDGWVYTISSMVANPQHASTYGDRVSFVHGQILYYSEDEFVSHCDALALAEANAQRNLERIQAQRLAICPTDLTGTS